ncbi:hypothetical protein EV363DRAFT_1155600 [Boletus edulis]|nr:hypothetical protein EV363DRAFT_1185953 [Boletus edulis]KAF8138622.1 hypothetical protein EV363DRAFT_1155600 [Boletus edulis]
MARPKLYNTPEERVIAARSYRAKYYQRLKEINQKIQEKRTINKLLVSVQQSAAVPLIGQPKGPSILSRRAGRPKRIDLQTDGHTKRPQVDVATNDTTEQIELALQHVIGGSSRLFVDSLCDGYLKGGDYSDIYGALTTVEQLDSRLRAIQLAASRCHEEVATTQKLRTMIRILEDLLLNAMEGNDIADLRERGFFLYQSVDDVCY